MFRHRRDQLLAAIDSGEFPKGVGCLQDKQGRWCCLGVASELFRRETGQGEWSEDRHSPDTRYKLFVLGSHVSPSYLLNEVSKWLGVVRDRDTNPSWDVPVPMAEGEDPDEAPHRLSIVNDRAGDSWEPVKAALMTVEVRDEEPPSPDPTA